MDITPQEQTTQPISDDQELAKALAGVLPDVPEPVVQDPPAPTPTAPAEPAADTLPTPTVVPTPAPATPVTDLESIKKGALGELRPLIDHVDLPAEEKFDTYLMLIRSTDDQTLVAPAYASAQAITDEKRKAEALLDIVKEIDYLSHKAA
ncbi:MAG: hypothetical protein JWM52_478 [Candidatus Saccharibacteria bacterium]|nr:hypothetical protein [Candidatus Saccharibacteria bacterium]